MKHEHNKPGTVFHTASFQAIYDRLQQVKPGAQRRWGKMNLVQMLNHLKIATGSGMHVYLLKDESNFLWRDVIPFIVLGILKRLPKNAKAPEGFKKEMHRELDFAKEKALALNMLERAHAATSDTFPHPMFGIMSRTRWGKLIYRHFDHHLRQFGA